MGRKIKYDVSDVAPDPGMTWMSDVEEERLTWLWPGYMPYGKVTILDGDPGIGKSTLALDLVARYSRGAAFPCAADSPCQHGVSLIVSGEDDLADTIKPRLRAAGADMGRILTLSLRSDAKGNMIPFSVPEDLPRLKEVLHRSGATFVVIDPITAFLSASVHSHNDASVRTAMTPLTVLAQTSGAAILLLRHLNKDTGTTKALYRGGGSIGFTGSARSVVLAERKPDSPDTLVLAQTKSNLAKRTHTPSLEWRVESWDKEPDIARINWLGPSELTADDLLRGEDGRRDPYAQREAIEFLREVLADGRRRTTVVKKEAKAEGITETTLKRARQSVGVHAFRTRTRAGQTEAWWLHLADQPEPGVCHKCRRAQGADR